MPPAEKTPDTRRTQMYKGVIELALMSLLADGAEYGLRILDGLRTQAGLDLAEGTLYPLLHRLEKGGWIVAEWRHEIEASHPRKYYRLTSEGAAELAEQSRTWLDMTGRLNAFLQRGAK